jgi:hypothetical protein
MPKGVNKQGPERYLQPDFILELLEKEVHYLFGADAEDPLFKAFVYSRRRHEIAKKIADRFPELDDKLLDPEDPAPGRLLTDAVGQGNIEKLKKFSDCFESKYQRKREEQSNPLPWEYYAARAALGFLVQGKLPLKKEVKAAALRERAIAELPVIYQVGTEELLPTLQEAEGPKEMRIDPEPASDQDSDSYYGAEEGELEHHPSSEPPAEAKPTLSEQRAKLINERIAELRRLHIPDVWKTTWARVFKNLELQDLPRC